MNRNPIKFRDIINQRAETNINNYANNNRRIPNKSKYDNGIIDGNKLLKQTREKEYQKKSIRLAKSCNDCNSCNKCPDKDSGNCIKRCKKIKRIRVDGNQCLRPNECCNISLKGRSGIQVRRSESDPSTAYISLNLFGNYVVDQCLSGCGQVEYGSLQAAITTALSEAGLRENKYDVINFIVKQGHYNEGQLTIKTPLGIKVNFISTTLGAYPGTTISGQIRSSGNVNWYGFKFVGKDSEYIIDDGNIGVYMDTFNNCVFTDNFRLIAEDDALFFDKCTFDYRDSLTNDDIFDIMKGNARIECLDCTFNITRIGSSNVTRFFKISANNQDTESRFNGCTFNLDSVQGDSPFYLFHLTGSQSLLIMNTNIYINNSSSSIYIIGGPTPQQNINLTIKTFYLDVNVSSPTARVFLVKDIWSPLPINGISHPIILEGCTIKNARLLTYFSQISDMYLNMSIKNSYISIGGNGPAITLNLSTNNSFNLNINSCTFDNKVPNTESIVVQGVAQTDINLSITDTQFINNSNDGNVNVNWGKNTGAQVDILYNSFAVHKYTNKFENATSVTQMTNTITI